MADRPAVVEKIREIAERVAASEGIDVVDVQLLGGGGTRVLRLFIDRLTPRALPAAEAEEGTELLAGVSLADCELMSHQVGTILDIEDLIPGGKYTLEVSSPGVERKLSRPHEFERFTGQKIKVTLKEPVETKRHWTGVLAKFAQGVITLEPAPGKTIEFPLELVEKANLKFEW
jgi:ribosome maturation factor RimP